MSSRKVPSNGLQRSGMSAIRGLRPLSESPSTSSLASKSTFQQPFDVAYDELQKQRDHEFIKDLFSECDVDGSGFIDRKEFENCMNHPRIFKIFNQRFGLQKHQTALVFSAMDVDGDHTVSLKEFLETCSFLMQVVKDGQVITNWRQKELRAMKETWPNQMKRMGTRQRRQPPGPSLAKAVMSPKPGGNGSGALFASSPRGASSPTASRVISQGMPSPTSRASSKAHSRYVSSPALRVQMYVTM